MFGSLGMPELLLILVIALIVFGPKKLPEVGRSLGKAMREFKRTTEEIKGKFEEQINAEEFKDLKTGLEVMKAEIKSATELPAEIRDLGKDLNGPLTEPAAPAAELAPAEAAPMATPEPGADVPAQAETEPAGTTRVETPDSAPHDDSASPHGKG
jgi:sec-independent protein translocase protein TatA